MTTKASPETPELSPFMREYLKGSQFSIDIDPRIDITKPVYEQAKRIWKQDAATARKQSVGER